MRIIVGLGNPGPDYERTRHNVGFLVADALAAERRIRISKRHAKSLAGRGTIGGVEAVVAKPRTFMNNSGRAVTALLDAYESGIDELLVVCDDFHLELGRLRARRSGSSGGQKGLQSIMDALGSEEFSRLRIGIGEARRDPVDFVLSEFRKAEKAVIEEAVREAVRACAVWAADGIEACMNEFNRTPAG